MEALGGARRLDQLERVPGQEQRQGSPWPVGARPLRRRHLDGERPPEPCERVVDRPHGEGQGPRPEADAVALSDGIGRVVGGRLAPEPGNLPELDEDAGRRARRDERRLVAATVVAPVDDPETVPLERRGVAVERALLQIEREVVPALAVRGEEALDGAPGTRALDQLELPVAEEEVGPPELAVVARARRPPQPDREELLPARQRGPDRPHGD